MICINHSQGGAAMAESRFSPDVLAGFAKAAYRAFGLPEVDADLLADSLVQADLWGHQSHGVMRTFWYGARFRSGATRPETTTSFVVDAGAVAVLDGRDGVGQVIAAQAMRAAIERAKSHGIGAVSVRNSGHFGTAMYFTRLAAEAGCIGFLSTNASPAMAPWGGRAKLIGNNPWSIAAPAGHRPPMMLDIANTAVARGKLYLARQRREPIPETWAIDAEGRPTTDAALGIAGTILPMAGHKGYGIAAMMDVLSGVLSGSGFADMVVGPYEPEGRSGVGHLAMALDIAAFRPVADFEADMERLIARIKAAPRNAEVPEVFYPGEPEALAEVRHRRDGVVIPADTLAALDEGAREVGIEALSARL